MWIEWYSFNEAREKNKSLSEIKRQTRKLATELKKEVSNDIIRKLNSEQWLEIKSWDTLNGINALTETGNRITWNKEANKIWPGDKITIENKEVFRNSKKGKIKVWEVKKWYTIETEENIDITKPFQISNYKQEQIIELSNKLKLKNNNLSISNDWYVIWKNWKYKIIWLIIEDPRKTDIENVKWILVENNWKNEKIEL